LCAAVRYALISPGHPAKHLLDQHQKECCSPLQQNNAADVLRPRSADALGQDISSSFVNWESNSENLMSLARDLGVSADSFIFLDDNPVECEAMRRSLPEVLTLQMPDRPADMPEFLRHIWAFDRPKATKEDQQRTVLYQKARERESLRKTVATIEDFLAGLDLKLD
jgi:FkbH-like protein